MAPSPSSLQGLVDICAHFSCYKPNLLTDLFTSTIYVLIINVPLTVSINKYLGVFKHEYYEEVDDIMEHVR